MASIARSAATGRGQAHRLVGRDRSILLPLLGAEHPRLLPSCDARMPGLSNSGFELDGLDDLLPDREQAMFDLAIDRERRREKQGYVTPAQARAFLQMSRQLRLGHDSVPPGNPVARAYFRLIDRQTKAQAAPPPSAASEETAPPRSLQQPSPPSSRCFSRRDCCAASRTAQRIAGSGGAPSLY